jgi:uncharacterized protein (UPF0335 family)
LPQKVAVSVTILPRRNVAAAQAPAILGDKKPRPPAQVLHIVIGRKEKRNMKVKDLLEEYNGLREALGIKKIRAWKHPKQELVEKIEKLRAEKKRGVGEMVKQLLQEVDGSGRGLPYGEVLRRVREEFPDGRTSRNCIYWYAKSMKKNGEVLPERPRDAHRDSQGR